MKVEIFIFCAAIVVAYAATLNQIDESWNNFKSSNKKSYASKEEEAKRKLIFVKNLKYIDEHNKLFQEGKTTYKLGLNKFADYESQEIVQKFTGRKRSNQKLKDIDVKTYKPPSDAEIPEEFDWRPKGAVTRVKDQADCGSCWSFSVTGVLEGQNFLQTGKLVEISEQDLIDCDTNNFGCGGGDMVPSYQYIAGNNGIDSEDSYPYEGQDAECRYKAKNNVTTVVDIYHLKEQAADDLKAAVALQGPISVAIDASSTDFAFYESGIFYLKDCIINPNELDHAVLAVGYGSESGDDYWIIKNSWAESWGEQGYIRVARNKGNDCGISSDASFPIV